MLSRIREAYDETGDTERAIELGLARTGKLVTSAAIILAFAFLVLSTSPGYEIKPLAIGVAAGIVLDATVVRALLVPALMRLMGRANWWTPRRQRIEMPMRSVKAELNTPDALNVR
jgi:RND superfamily putative drug exporter